MSNGRSASWRRPLLAGLALVSEATLASAAQFADEAFQLIKMSPKMNEQVAKALGCKPSETNEKVDELDEEDD